MPAVDLKADVGSLMVFQLCSRLLTFFINTAVLRMASPLVLGISSIKLDLFLGTSLFLARDGVRMALIRLSPPPSDKVQKKWYRKFISASWISFPIGVTVALVLVAIFASHPPAELLNEPRALSQYYRSLIIYGVSILLELLVEPVASLLIYHQRTRQRLSLDFISNVLKMIVVLSIIKNGGKMLSPADEMEVGMRAFSYGQLCRSTTFLIGMCLIFKSQFPLLKFTDLIPSWDLDSGTAAHAWEMTKQLVLKYALSQGDMWIISAFCRVSDQGVYSVVLNYGSLVCRLILQPLEESGLQYFSRAFASRNDKELQKKAFKHLALILKFDLLLSMGFALVAPWYTGLLVRILLGQRWASTPMPTVLAAYCLQIPAMAFCGILESFMNSTISPDWYRVTRIASMVFSFIYIVTAIALVKAFDTVGLVAAGIISFGLRALLGAFYLTRQYKPSPFRTKDIMPSKITILSFLTAACISALSLYNSFGTERTLVCAVASLGLVGIAVVRHEKPFLQALNGVFVNSKAKQA